MSIYSTEKLNSIWEKATIVPGRNEHELRKDYAGAWIRKEDYGKETAYGWQVDHIKPVSKDGSNELKNLDPLHWMNNRKKGDNYPEWETEVTSENDRNIITIERWEME